MLWKGKSGQLSDQDGLEPFLSARPPSFYRSRNKL